MDSMTQLLDPLLLCGNSARTRGERHRSHHCDRRRAWLSVLAGHRSVPIDQHLYTIPGSWWGASTTSQMSASLGEPVGSWSRKRAMAMRLTQKLALAGAFVGLVGGLPAFAAQVDPADQAEWRQGYEEATNLAVPRSPVPMLSSDSAAATEAAIAHYREIAANGGWGSLPTNLRVKLGARGKAVVALRQRLLASGDLDQADSGSDTYD